MKIIAQNINLNSRYIPQKEAKVHSYYDLRVNTPVNKSNVSQLNFKSLLQNFTKPQVLNRKAAISKIKSYLTVCKDTIKVEDYLDVFKTKGGYDLEKIKKLSFLNKVGKDKHLISQLFYAVIFRTKSFDEASDAVNLLLDSGYYVYETIKILDIASRENDDKFRYPELPKLAADLKATHPEAAYEIIDTATEDRENHFNRKAFDKILELEKIFPSVDAVDIIYNCHNEDNVFIDGCLNEINNLINLGFDADQITGILETARDNYKHSYTAEGFKLTENLPEWVKKDKKLIKKFIISRIVSTDNVFSEFSVKNYKIFNNFANFVNIDNHEKDLGLCETLTAFFENEKLDKHYIQTLEVAKRINLKQALQFAWLDSAGECQMAMKLMDANLKKPIDVVSILYDSDTPDSNLKKVHKYLELYNFANEQNFEISINSRII